MKKRKKTTAKPTSDFPLYPSGNGQWAKTINKKRYNFGVVADPTAALKRYHHELPYLLDGIPRSQIPPLDGNEQDTRWTIAHICEQFIQDQYERSQDGQIKKSTFKKDMLGPAKLVAEFVGKEKIAELLKPADFKPLAREIAKRHKSFEIQRNKIRRCKAVFKYAYDNEWIDRPVRYGNYLAPPKPALMRRQRRERPRKLWQPERFQLLIDAAPVRYKAIWLLMANTACGPTDICELCLHEIDLETGWYTQPRTKNDIDRRVKLWPESLRALKEWLCCRESNLPNVFITQKGAAFERTEISRQMRKQLVKLGDRQYRETPEFFRKTFRTIATNAAIPQSEAPICLVMGREIEGIKKHYIEAIHDDRLIAVSEEVRAYYFANPVPIKQHLETDEMLEAVLIQPLARLTHETNQLNTLQIN